jgi:predicted lipoprotein with Yx(FWY)xxD motif
MTMRQSIRWGATCAAVLFGVTACGSTGNGGTAAPGNSSGPSAIKVASTSLGKVLVDGNGMTLYMLTSDKPGRSRCSSSCLSYWPPAAALPSGTRPTGVTAPVSSTKDTAGKPIATVGGWPLYTFVQDKAPGDVTGQGVKSYGGVWYALSPSGQPVTKAPTSSGAAGTGGY